jgi:hypothetical protein
MSWSVTVNDVANYEGFPLDLQEFFASQHPSYPRDAEQALETARVLNLKSATLTGMRTPNPYGGDEIVDVSVRGTPLYKDFLLEMREIIASGIDGESDLARHWAALARLRQRPCSHIFESVPPIPITHGGDYEQNVRNRDLKQCAGCHVYMNGTMLYFAED